MAYDQNVATDLRNSLSLYQMLVADCGPPGGTTANPAFKCPFHEDSNPSLSYRVFGGVERYKCWVCAAKGDAIEYVKRTQGLGFTEQAARLKDGQPKSRRKTSSPPRTSVPASPPPEPKVKPKPPHCSQGEAEAFVADSVRRLWSEAGRKVLDYLAGPTRLLTRETVRKAMLGYTPGNDYRSAWRGAPGIVIPWIGSDGRLAGYKLRPDEPWLDVKEAELGKRPGKYLWGYHDKPRLRCYPDLSAVPRNGRPSETGLRLTVKNIIMTEGEFDALLLAQSLGPRYAVVTLGSTGDAANADDDFRFELESYTRWFTGFDADTAGRVSAKNWEDTKAEDVKPPAPFKDWSAAAAGGVALAWWWSEVVAGASDERLVEVAERSMRRPDPPAEDDWRGDAWEPGS